jgi:hypothetical protein
MKKPSIYLDTSVINFLFADDAPEKQYATIDFFENYIRRDIYQVMISPVVIDEINKTRDDEKRKKLLDVVREYEISIVDVSGMKAEIGRLAGLYITGGIIPQKKLEDALHLAVCTITETDIFLSWNYKHLSNVNKERRVMSVNIAEGYTKAFRMITPLEVLYEDQ